MCTPSQEPWYLGVSKCEKCFLCVKIDVRLPSVRRYPCAFGSRKARRPFHWTKRTRTYTDGLWFTFALKEKNCCSRFGGILVLVRTRSTALSLGDFRPSSWRESNTRETYLSVLTLPPSVLPCLPFLPQVYTAAAPISRLSTIHAPFVDSAVHNVQRGTSKMAYRTELIWGKSWIVSCDCGTVYKTPATNKPATTRCLLVDALRLSNLLPP